MSAMCAGALPDSTLPDNTCNTFVDALAVGNGFSFMPLFAVLKHRV